MSRAKRQGHKFRKALAWGLAALAVWVVLFRVYPRVQGYLAAHKAKHVPVAEYNSMFDDMNPVQLKAAKRFGVQPIADRSYDFDGCGKLRRIRSCKAYHVDRLTHSVPYLTAGAQNLLEDIGTAFQ